MAARMCPNTPNLVFKAAVALVGACSKAESPHGAALRACTSLYVRLATLTGAQTLRQGSVRPTPTPSTRATRTGAALHTKLSLCARESNMADVPADLSAFADELADAAGAVIRKYWRTSVEVISKDARLDVFADEPVTIADRESERVMRDMIEKRYPAHAILGEEHGEKGDGRTSEWAWVLDPVDGTKSFITGKPLFGTLIALLNYGKPVLGVIDQCVLKERWKGTLQKRPSTGCLVSQMIVRHYRRRWSTRRRRNVRAWFGDASMELLEFPMQARAVWLRLLRVWAVCVWECAARV